MANQFGEPEAEGGFATGEVDLADASLGDRVIRRIESSWGRLVALWRGRSWKVAKQKPQPILYDFQRW